MCWGMGRCGLGAEGGVRVGVKGSVGKGVKRAAAWREGGARAGAGWRERGGSQGSGGTAEAAILQKSSK